MSNTVRVALMIVTVSLAGIGCASRAFQSANMRLIDGKLVFFTEYRTSGNNAVQGVMAHGWVCDYVRVKDTFGKELLPTESPVKDCVPFVELNEARDSIAKAAVQGPVTAAIAGMSYVGGQWVRRPNKYINQESIHNAIQGGNSQGGSSHAEGGAVGDVHATGGAARAHADGGTSRSTSSARVGDIDARSNASTRLTVEQEQRLQSEIQNTLEQEQTGQRGQRY